MHLQFPPTLEMLLEAEATVLNQWLTEENLTRSKYEHAVAVEVVRGKWLNRKQSDAGPVQCYCPIAMFCKAARREIGTGSGADLFGVDRKRIDTFIEGIDYWYKYLNRDGTLHSDYTHVPPNPDAWAGAKLWLDYINHKGL